MEIFSCYDNILMHNILIRIFSFTFVKLKIVCCHDGEQFIVKTRRFHWIVSALLSGNNFNNKTDNTMKKYKYNSIGTVPKSNNKLVESDTPNKLVLVRKDMDANEHARLSNSMLRNKFKQMNIRDYTTLYLDTNSRK